MCGIVGFIDRNKSIATINDMLAIQSHRGPDDHGDYFDKNSGVHFGHNRLSVQDLSSLGHSPISSFNDSVPLMFFNFELV